MNLINQIAIAANKYKAKFNSTREGGVSNFIQTKGESGTIASRIGNHFLKTALFLLFTLGFRMVSYSQVVNNLVINGSFENTTPTCGNFAGCLDEPFNANVNCVTNWKAAVGTPNLCRALFGLGAFQGTNFASCSATSNNSCRTESFGQDLTLFAGQPYTIGFACRTAQFQPAPEPAVDVVVYGKTATIPGINGNGGLGSCPLPSSYQQLALFPNFLNLGWTNLSQTFTPTTNLQSFIIWPYQKSNKSSITSFDAVTISCTSLMDLGFTITHGQNYTVQFTGLASSSISGLTVARWLWDFGDGTTSTLQNPSHTFSSSGSRNVCLTITDNRGCTKVFCQNVDFPEMPCLCPGAGIAIDGGAQGVSVASLNLPAIVTGCVSISGKLIVDANLTLDEAKVRMATGSEIEVVNGAILTIQGGSRLRACEKMWRGIVVRSGASVSIQNSTIGDAYIGVDCNAGSRLHFASNEFLFNWKGIRIVGNTVTIGSSVTYGFLDNSFIGGTLLPNFPGMTPTATTSLHGIELSGVPLTQNRFTGINSFFNGLQNAVFIQNCAGTQFVTSVKIRNCGTGVNANSSSIYVKYNTIENVTTGVSIASTTGRFISIAGNTISANTCINALLLRNCFLDIDQNTKLYVTSSMNSTASFGIRLGWVTGPTNKVTKNKIFYSQGAKLTGIDLNTSSNVLCEGNFVYADQVFNNPTGNISGLSEMEGIRLIGSNNFSNIVTENKVFGPSTSIGKSFTVTGATGWEICNNEATNNKLGYDFNNNCRSTNGYKINKMNSHEIGLNINNMNTIIGQQWFFLSNPAQTEGTGNLWEMNSNPAQTGFYADPNASEISNQFRVNPNQNPNYMPAIVNAPNGMIRPTATFNMSGCQSLPIIGDGTDEKIARNNFGKFTFDAATVYMMQRDLFDKIQYGILSIGSAITTTPTEIDSFYQANQNTNLGIFAKINKQIEDYVALDSYNATTLHTIMNQNAAIVPSAIWEENEQKVNGLRINRLLANNWEFSSSESLDLLNISAQCPRTNGLSIYQARLMYGMVEPTIDFSDDLLCTFDNVIPRSAQSTTILDEKITFSPNPTEGIIRIEIGEKGALEDSFQFEALDLLGRSVCKHTISGSATIDLTQQKSGMYICQIKKDGKLVKTEKIVIQK